MFKLIGLILASIIGLAQAQLTHVDFLYDPVYTNSYFWWNYVGITMNFTEIQPFYNTSLFQGYLQNSNLKGNWYNNFMGSVRHPKGYFYNCAALGRDNTTGCSHQLAGTTYFPKFGQFVWNTMNQPYWTYGVNNQKLDLLDTDTMDSMYSYYMDIYKYTHYVTYMIEMMWEGDKAVQNGMRDNFTVADFLSDAWQYEQILYGLSYKSPGITETASSQWLGNLTQFYDQCWQGIFTFESVIFTDPTLATIQNLLSDNYTKGYLQRRARVNSSYTYSDFGNYPASLSKVRLVPGQGIDGITNTFAAALWWIDFLMESTMYGFFDISIEGAIRPGNFQSVFGPPPTYTPTALYYGSIMGALIGDQIPNIVLPKYTAGTSSHIKVWGLELRTKNKFLILNKDTNTSLTGVVIIQTRSEKNVPMKCIYLQAPSLTEKTNILIGGHSYIAGNFTAQGPLKQLTFLYEPGVFGFSVPIKYAQAALCQIPNPDYIIPTMNADKKCYSPNYIYSLVGLTVSIIIILI